MLARIRSAALLGLESIPITLEVSITNGLPAFHVVGLPDAAVRESRERVVSALRTSGFEFPLRRITANLAPAHVRKEGSAFDLPLALAVLAASGQVAGERAADWLVVGELALDGGLRAVRGALAYAECARAEGAVAIVLPRANAAEAALVPGVDVLGPATLAELVDGLRGGELHAYAAPATVGARDDGAASPPNDAVAADAARGWIGVAGQEVAKRALEIAAAGGHNALLVGPPGSGKTELARALPALLPPLDDAEALELTRIHSVAGLLDTGGGGALLRARPFRAPHSSVSTAGLLGGGSPIRPGEVTLAHRGVLFLDELPEFRRDALEALRAPLEERAIRVVRAAGTVRFPAAFLWIAAMNPCPCGGLGQPRRGCRCSPDVVRRYRGRVSGPLLDRIDLHVEVGAVKAQALTAPRARADAERLTCARERVAHARRVQREREPGRLNAELTADELERAAPLGARQRARLAEAMERFGLSARGAHRAWRVARTIADLEGGANVDDAGLAEALGLREPSVTV